MALTWNWKDKIGEAENINGTKYNLYRGNALTIAIWEDDDKYQLAWFFASETHAKNCMGLTKDFKDNSINDYGIAKIKLNTRYKETEILCKLFCRAKAKFLIELYEDTPM